jgi:hypothetical protein
VTTLMRDARRLAWAALVVVGPGGATATGSGAARAAQPRGGQATEVIDAGSFTVVRGTAKIGREEFTIRRAAPPDNGFLVSGTSVYADRRLTPTLGTDSAGAPQRYQIEVRSAERRQEILTLQIVRGRGSQRTQTPHGESATEFRVSADARLLDDDVFNQYYFIARRVIGDRAPAPGTTVTVPTVMPHRSAESAVRVMIVGDDSVMVGGRLLDATRLHLAAPTGGDREIWVDASGRVLKVSIPARDVVATRDDAPR